MRIVLAFCALLVACGPNENSTVKIDERTNVKMTVQDGLFSLMLRREDGAELAIGCGRSEPRVYVDTRQPSPTPPALSGVHAAFVTDTETFDAEVAWAASPPSAWTVRQPAAAAGIARALVGAVSIRFEPPRDYSRGEPVEWALDLSAKDRDQMAKACQSSHTSSG